MKKIFLLLILLLNLHIAINEGGISLESGHVFAQIQYEETLDEVVVPGNAYGICEYCKSQILKSELLFHQQHQCYYREATCDICHQKYRPAEGDCLCKYNKDSNDNNNNNNENDYTICYKCGQLKKQCTCKENNPDERNPTNSISLGGESGNNSNGSSQNNGTNTNSNTNNHPVDTDSLCVGGHYISNQYNHLCKDSVLIPPLQTDSTTCVSTTLAYTQLWVNDWPVDKLDSIKSAIEEKYYLKYKERLPKRGVPEKRISEFILMESGIHVQPVSLTELKTKMDQGHSGIGTLVIKGANEKVWGHEIAIIGYDNDGNFICKDPQKMEPQKYTKEELETFNKLGWGNSIFYIEKEY